LYILLVVAGISRRPEKRLGNHPQRFCPGRLIDVTAHEFENSAVIAVDEAHKFRADIGCCVVLLKLLMLELKRRLRILDTFKHVMGS
jgi:hypothetical protein